MGVHLRADHIDTDELEDDGATLERIIEDDRAYFRLPEYAVCCCRKT